MSDIPDVELVFVSGGLNPDIWRHQVRYFEKCCDIETVGGLEAETLRNEVLKILEDCDNAIIIGSELGNLVAQSVEDHENVVSTVLTGTFDSFNIKSHRVLQFGLRLFDTPKLCKKIFFNDSTDYKIVKEFVKDSGRPKKDVIQSYYGLELEVPLKNSLIIYNQNCRFSTMGKVEELKSNSEIAILDSGSFSFYEKPQEFNKALHDYLQSKSELLERRELVKAATENRSLKDFETMRLER